MSEPSIPDLCWDVDTSCCATWDDYPETVQDRAIALATTSLRALSGYRVGGCPTTVRPCRQGCAQPFLAGSSGLDDPTRGFGPVLWAGTWINVGCGCGMSDCDCTTVCEVKLPGPVGFVESVQIGEQVLPETWYRVDNGNRLVWQGPDDIGCWPLCQDMSAPAGQPGTFTVTYLHALPVDGLAAYAAGVLACEFAKACSGQKCRLPSGVVAVARQGVSFTLRANPFDSGQTGIPEVDAWLRTVNPNGMVQPSRVWSPDLRTGRVTTWTQ